MTTRAAVVAAAESWIGTPYVHAGRVKGCGVDCATLLAEVFTEAGAMDTVKLDYYPSDWHLHRNHERYLEELGRYAQEIEGPPLPGDVVVWKIGRTFSHGGIVTAWPNFIHSYLKIGVVRGDAEKDLWLKFVGENGPNLGKLREIKFFRLKEWC